MTKEIINEYLDTVKELEKIIKELQTIDLYNLDSKKGLYLNTLAEVIFLYSQKQIIIRK